MKYARSCVLFKVASPGFYRGWLVCVVAVHAASLRVARVPSALAQRISVVFVWKVSGPYMVIDSPQLAQVSNWLRLMRGRRRGGGAWLLVVVLGGG